MSQPCSTAGISIHALREEGDTSFGSLSPISSQFLSTPSARRATPQVNTVVFQFYYFYPRPPRGGRPTAAAPSTSAAYFYPRPPRGGRLLPRLPEKPYMEISIHALREEGDDGQQLVQVVRVDFYPRPPRGGRPSLGKAIEQAQKFLSTPSARRATRRGGGDAMKILYISIHALREEGDSCPASSSCRPTLFLSTPSARRATCPLRRFGR